MTEQHPDPADEEPRDERGADPGGAESLDAQFDAIVAGLDLGDGGTDDDSDELVVEDERPASRGPGSFEELRAWVDVDPDLLAPPPEDDVAPELDEHYVPPTPPPVPRGDAVSRWAWAAALGGPIASLVLALLGFDLAGPLGIALIAASAGGFVTLVYRMKDGPRVDDGPDNGAVV